MGLTLKDRTKVVVINKPGVDFLFKCLGCLIKTFLKNIKCGETFARLGFFESQSVTPKHIDQFILLKGTVKRTA